MKESKLPQYAAKFGRNLAAGVGDIAHIPGIIHQAPEILVHKARAFLDSKQKKKSDEQIEKILAGPGERIAKSIDKATGDYTKPSTSGERIAESVTRAIPSLPVGFGASQVKTLPGLAKAALSRQNIGSTLGAAGLSQAAIENSPDDMLGSAAGTVAGSVLGGKLAGISKIRPKPNVEGYFPRTGRWVGEKLSVNPDKVKAFKDTGVSPTFSNVSDSPNVSVLENRLSKMPFSSKPIVKAREKQHDQVKGLVESFGTPSEAPGELLRKGAENYSQTQKDIYKKGADKVLAGLEKDAVFVPVAGTKKINLLPMENTQKFLDEYKANFPLDETSQKLYQKTKVAPFEDDLSKLKKSYADTGLVPLSTFKGIQDNVDDMVSSWGQIGNKSQSSLKKLRTKMNGDIGKYLHQIDPEVGEQWTANNKFWENFRRRDTPHLDKILDKSIPEESLFNKALNDLKSKDSNKQRFKVSFNGLDGKEKNAVSNSFIQALGNKNGEFHTYHFATQFNKLPKESKKLLMSGLPESSATKLETLLKSANHMKETLSTANTSFTHVHKENEKFWGDIGKTVGAFGTGGFALGAKVGLPVVGAILGSSAMSAHVLTNPKFIKWASQGVDMNPEQYAKHFEKLGPMIKGGKLFNQELQNVVRSSMRDANGMDEGSDEEHSDLHQMSDAELEAIVGDSKGETSAPANQFSDLENMSDEELEAIAKG